MSVFLFVVALYGFVAVFIDSINVFAPTNGITLANTKNILWPPQFFLINFFWWTETCDPLLQHNPFWLKVLAVYSPFIYTPLYLLAIYAFIKGRNWIKTPLILWVGALWATLIVILAEGIYGEFKSNNVPLFFGTYVGYGLFPLLVLYRVSGREPFSKEKRN